MPLTQLDDALFAELSELKTLSGILALIDIPPRSSGSRTTASFALLLEDIQDPGNLGSMLRSAAAAGCDQVFLSMAVPTHGRPGCCAPRWVGILC